MTQPTPGPWETDNIAVRSIDRQICLCEITVRGRPYDETYDEALANARLIAAAPDLLGALKFAEDTLSRAPMSTQFWPGGMHPNEGISILREAIAKAEGVFNPQQREGGA
jgi:hypothetical protein